MKNLTVSGINSVDHQEALQKTGFWGKKAAGVLFFSKETKRFLFMLRSSHVLEPGTYGLIGGALDKDESPEQGVRREVEEETGYKHHFDLVPLYVYRHDSGFEYHNFLGIIDKEFHPELDWENAGYEWVNFGNWPKPLHPGVVKLLADHNSFITIKKHAGVDAGIVKAEVITAGLSSVLFHTTSSGTLLKILETNKFILTTTVWTPVENLSERKDYLYFLSCARNRNSRYLNGAHVIIELDGRKLGQKYLGKPVDYWGKEYRMPKEDWSEQEDRVFSKTSTIPNANSYIKNISITYNKKLDDADWAKYPGQTRDLVKIIELSDKYKIPLFIYESPKALALKDKRKLIPVDKLLDKLSGVDVSEVEDRDIGSYDLEEIQAAINAFNLIKELSQQDKISLAQAMKEKGYNADKSKNSFSESAEEAFFRRNKHDFVAQLGNAISNSRKYMTDKKLEATDNLIKLMRKEKVANLNEFYDKFEALYTIVKRNDDAREHKDRLDRFINEWKAKGVEFDLKRIEKTSPYEDDISEFSGIKLKDMTKLDTLGQQALDAIKKYAGNWLWSHYIKLIPKNDLGKYKDQLTDFYERNGFKPKGDNMICDLYK